VAQHFLLSAAARTLSLSAVARMSDKEAHATFSRIRWADNGGAPYCPRCGCLKVHALSSRPVWKCSGCAYQFSVTAGTIFADRKRPIRDYLLAIAIFANGAKGHSALQLSRDLACQYKTAFVFFHKLREVIETEHRQDHANLNEGSCSLHWSPQKNGLFRRVPFIAISEILSVRSTAANFWYHRLNLLRVHRHQRRPPAIQRPSS
jgi:transposase-like protein